MRVLHIINLCIAFTLILWYASIPFLADHHYYKKQYQRYENVLKDNPTKQYKYKKAFHKFQRETDHSFKTKLYRSGIILAKGIPPYLQAWLFFGVIISIYGLKQRKEVVYVVALLPLLAGLYATDNYYYGADVKPTPEEVLIPNEKQVIAYAEGSLPENIGEQHTYLKKAWDNYLLKKYGGERNFQEAVLQESIASPEKLSSEKIGQKKSIWVLTAFVLWSVLLAGSSLAYLRKDCA